MKFNYKLSKSNKWLTLSLILILLVLTIRIIGFSAYTFGILIGLMITVLLIPALISILVWAVAPKKTKTQSLAYNILIVLFFFSACKEILRTSDDLNKPYTNIKKAKEVLQKNIIRNSDSTDIFFQKYYNEVMLNIDLIIKNSNSSDREAFSIFKEYLKKFNKTYGEWNSSYNRILEDDIMNTDTLYFKKNYSQQILIIEKYITESEKYKEFITTDRNKFFKNNLFTNDKINDEFLKGFIQSYKLKDSIQQPIIRDYLNGHIQYGIQMRELVKILKNSNGSWKMENEFLEFKDDKNITQYDSILNLLTKNEKIVNELSNEVNKVM